MTPGQASSKEPDGVDALHRKELHRNGSSLERRYSSRFGLQNSPSIVDELMEPPPVNEPVDILTADESSLKNEDTMDETDSNRVKVLRRRKPLYLQPAVIDTDDEEDKTKETVRSERRDGYKALQSKLATQREKRLVTRRSTRLQHQNSVNETETEEDIKPELVDSQDSCSDEDTPRRGTRIRRLGWRFDGFHVTMPKVRTRAATFESADESAAISEPERKPSKDDHPCKRSRPRKNDTGTADELQSHSSTEKLYVKKAKLMPCKIAPSQDKKLKKSVVIKEEISEDKKPKKIVAIKEEVFSEDESEIQIVRRVTRSTTRMQPLLPQLSPIVSRSKKCGYVTDSEVYKLTTKGKGSPRKYQKTTAAANSQASTKIHCSSPQAKPGQKKEEPSKCVENKGKPVKPKLTTAAVTKRRNSSDDIPPPMSLRTNTAADTEILLASMSQLTLKIKDIADTDIYKECAANKALKSPKIISKPTSPKTKQPPIAAVQKDVTRIAVKRARIYRRKNDISEKEFKQLYGEDFDASDLAKQIPIARTLRSGREIKTEDEESGEEAIVESNKKCSNKKGSNKSNKRRGYESAPEYLPKKQNVRTRRPSYCEKKSTPSEDPAVCVPRFTRSSLLNLPQTKDPVKNSSEVLLIDKKASTDNRKNAACPKNDIEIPALISSKKEKVFIEDTPSTTERPSTSGSQSSNSNQMPTLVPFGDYVGINQTRKVRFSGSTIGTDEVIVLTESASNSPTKRASVKEIKKEVPDMAELESDGPPTLSPPVRSLRSSSSPQKPKDQIQSRSPVRKPSFEKEAAQKAAPSSPTKLSAEKTEERKKESDAAPRMRQRAPVEQTIKTRTNSKTKIALSIAPFHLQSIVTFPDTPDSQSTPEPLISSHNSAATIAKRKPKSPKKVELDDQEEKKITREEKEHPPLQMRSKTDGDVSPVALQLNRKRKGDLGLLITEEGLIKRAKKNNACSSTASEFARSSTKSSHTSSYSLVSSVEGSPIKRKVPKLEKPEKPAKTSSRRKDYIPRKITEEVVMDMTPDSDVASSSTVGYSPQRRPEDYASTFENTLKMYKEVGDRRRELFMKRNLGYAKAVHKEEIVKNHRIAEDLPPRLYEKESQRKKDSSNSYSTREKMEYLKRIITILTTAKYSLKRRYGIAESLQLSVGTLAKAEMLESKGRGKGKLYICNKLEPENEDNTSEASSYQSDVMVDSVIFSSLRHQILPGRRVAWTEVFLAYETKGLLSKLHLMKSTLFPLWINEQNKTTIDLVDQKEDYDRMYIVTRVEITQNLASCNVKGHTLRSRNAGDDTSTRVTYFPKPGEYPIEHVYWGATLYHEPNGAGYRLGSVNIELINRNLLPIRNHGCKGFLKELLNAIKKNNTNPFLVTEVKRRPTHELSSSENEDYFSEDEDEYEDEIKERNSVDYEQPSIKKEAVDWDDIAECDSREESVSITQKEVISVAANDTFNALMGKFKPRNGLYVNDKEMLKALFHDQKILQDQRKMAIINKWMPLAFPKNIQYRFLCLTKDFGRGRWDEENTEYSSEDQQGRYYTMQFKKLNWMVSDQETASNCCIICGWSFPDLYTLMLHYNTTYPRLCFIFSVKDKLFTKCKSAADARVVIDVMLAPGYKEVNETFPTGIPEPIRRISATLFLTTRAVSKALKLNMRRDNTIFARILKIPEITEEMLQFASRFIDTDTGLPLTYGEEVNYDTRKVPNPSFEALNEKLLRILQDYIDIDQVTKNFMCTWNQMVIAIGRYNQVVLGAYLQHKLFINVFWHLLNTEDDWKMTFCTHLMEYTDAGVLSADESHDLWERIYNPKYDPLKDPNSSIYVDIMDHVFRKHRTMKRNKRKGKIANEGAVAPYYRKNPRDMKKAERNKLVSFMYNRTKVISKMDPRRLFLADPLEKISGTEMEDLVQFFNDMKPVEIREGELDMNNLR